MHALDVKIEMERNSKYSADDVCKIATKYIGPVCDLGT